MRIYQIPECPQGCYVLFSNDNGAGNVAIPNEEGDRIMSETEFIEIEGSKTLINKVEVEPRVSLLEIQYKDETKGIDVYSRLFANDDGKLDFEGDVTESARFFFEECLKPMCEKYIEELNATSEKRC